MTNILFETTVQKATEVIRRIGDSDPFLITDDEALDALRAVLTTLRDRLPVEQVSALGAQLTPLLRGIYYEGWRAGVAPQKMHRELFLSTVAGRLRTPYPGPIEELVRLVLVVVGSTIEPAELIKLRVSVLPADLADLLPV